MHSSYFFPSGRLCCRAVLLEKPPPSKRNASLHSRHNSSSSRAFLSVVDKKPGVKGSGVRSLPSSPLLKPTAGNSTPKYLPIGGSPRIQPLSPSSPKPSTTPLRVRIIHLLALGPAAEQTLQEKTRALRTELGTCLQDVARKIAPGSSQWELKDESYRDLKPREWKYYTSIERQSVEKKQKEILARLPPPAPIVEEAKITTQSNEIAKKKAEPEGEEPTRLIAPTPKFAESPVVQRPSTPTIPAKRPAEDEVVNPVRKVGGGIISGGKKKPAPNTAPKDKPVPKSTRNDNVTSTATATSKPSSSKKTKDHPKYKSEERIVGSDSDEDIPLERQVSKVSQRDKVSARPESRNGLKGLGISSVEIEPKRENQAYSPPISSSNRPRTTSSSSSNNSHSPPKKRSPLATNEPITARRGKSPSPPPLVKKRSREDDVNLNTKRQKVPIKEKERAPIAKPQPLNRSKVDSSAPIVERESDHPKPKKISQEHHNIANRFRQLYPEYQKLHRRLQGLDADGLVKEKSNIDKLVRMQEQLAKWKAQLWKAAGETRHVATERTSGMVGVRV
jgi:RNA polymerase II elongation factor ELL